MTFLITGGAGFIGSNLVRLALERGHEVVTLDALTYAGSEENLSDLNPEQHQFIKGNITNKELVESVIREGFHGRTFDAVINCAAETHVDRSLVVATPFADSNVLGTAVLLETARRFEVPLFLQVSTDEVYGSITGDGKFTRQSPFRPSSPYSASKAGADLFALSFVHSWNYDVRITRCTNNYGPYQFPEKFIPVIITNALLGKKIPVYGDGLNIRDWIFVRDHCDGILSVVKNGKAGVVYHFGGSNELTNIDLCTRILTSLAHELGKDEAEFLSLITYVEDRPGHDRRYALDWSDSETEIGWTPTTSWEQGLQNTVQWYLQNRNWWSTKL
jgi:dTDP-glucose 4,6-dehydratase